MEIIDLRIKQITVSFKEIIKEKGNGESLEICLAIKDELEEREATEAIYTLKLTI